MPGWSSRAKGILTPCDVPGGTKADKAAAPHQISVPQACCQASASPLRGQEGAGKGELLPTERGNTSQSHEWELQPQNSLGCKTTPGVLVCWSSSPTQHHFILSSGKPEELHKSSKISSNTTAQATFSSTAQPDAASPASPQRRHCVQRQSPRLSAQKQPLLLSEDTPDQHDTNLVAPGQPVRTGSGQALHSRFCLK